MDALAGKRILLTGVTGFLGQVILERLLLDFPDTHVTVLVRSQQSSTAVDRVHYLTRKPAFDVLRERLGGDDALLALLDERVDVIDGDFTRGEPDIPDGIDVVIHSAATVSFDPPIDEGFQTNLLGAQNLYRGATRNNTPHLVHVSTAYVAGVQKGVIPEGPLDHKVDYALEAEMALQARARGRVGQPQARDARALHGEGREGALPRRPHHGQHRRRGAPQGAGWIKRLIEYGRMRARTLGWPDVYTFTKAMGERAVEDLAHAQRPSLSIVRPSIIESALEHPLPGWIDGFKMADPIIRAYGLGQIPEFPGIPEGIVDLIPVDYVVNAILAVAATPPPAGEPAHYNVSSGDRNPLRFFELYEYVREYFEAHPLPERGRGEHKVPEWKFPGNLKVETMLRRAETLHRPRREGRDAPAEVQGDARRRRPRRSRQGARRLRQALLRPLRHVHRDRGRLHRRPGGDAVGQSLTPEDRERFPFDAGVLDWKYYLQDVHCPAVTQSPARAVAQGPREADREDPLARRHRARRLRHGGHDHLVQRRRVLRVDAVRRPADRGVAGRAGQRVRADPGLPADRPSRPRRLPADVLPAVRGRERRRRRRARCATTWPSSCCRRRCPPAIRRIREHRAAGHRTVMITAAAEPFVRPFAPLFDVLIGAELEERDGRYTGFMSAPPLVGEARAAWLKRYATDNDIDLRHSYAYADSYSDLPLLRAVGNPVAVAPDSALYRHARRRRWPIEEWAMSKGMPKVRFPKPAVR